MKNIILSLMIVLGVSACSHKTNTDKTGPALTQSDIQEFESVVSEKTKSGIAGYGQNPNGDVVVTTKAAEIFVLHHASNGWVIVYSRLPAQ